MDCIQLTGIRCYGYTGYLPEEQVLGQWFEVDVTLWVDLSQAGKSDDIQHTLDYRSAITLIQQLVKDSKFLLIERLADAIAQALLELALVEKVKIQLSKPAAPIPDFGGRITLEITRTKDETAVETASTPTMSQIRRRLKPRLHKRCPPPRTEENNVIYSLPVKFFNPRRRVRVCIDAVSTAQLSSTRGGG